MRKRTIILPALAIVVLCTNAFAETFADGQASYEIGEYEAALGVWQPLADSGDAESQFGVGLLYANGFGVALDDAQALKWYGLAAEQGHGQAMCNIAVMNANGWGVPQSDSEALKWYSLAAEQGIAEAHNALSQMYLSGFGVEMDKAKAYMFLSIAAELGGGSAHYSLEDLERQLSAEEFSGAKQMVTEWFETHPDMLASQ